MNASNCIHFQTTGKKIKPILLCYTINTDLLNLHICKSKPCCLGSQQVCLLHIPVTGVSQCVFKTGVGLMAFIALLLVLIKWYSVFHLNHKVSTGILCLGNKKHCWNWNFTPIFNCNTSSGLQQTWCLRVNRNDFLGMLCRNSPL